MSAFDPSVPQLFLDNGFVPSTGGRLDIIDPATLEKIGVIAEPTVTEVDRAIARANAAQKEWAALDLKSRAGLLHAIADSIERTSPRAVAELRVKGMGKA
jgi:acyl-CoA reductase-like NAD-dependent aldehyde dehydrogenase